VLASSPMGYVVASVDVVKFDWDSGRLPVHRVMSKSDPTRFTALNHVEDTLRQLDEDGDVRAICLFGSAAREQADDQSDIDVLVVVPDTVDASKMRERVRLIQTDDRAQVRLMTEGRLRDAFTGGTVFAAHLAHEGQVVVDRDGALTALLESHPKDAPVRETAKNLASQLQAYDDLRWCGGYYLFCLSDLYAWGRSGSMLAVTRAGEFEFDRENVFTRLVVVHPDLAAPAQVIRRLRPFWETVNGRRHSSLPFPPVGAHAQAIEARDACRAILAKSL
jgi:predicted nucleotidyltransferase